MAMDTLTMIRNAQSLLRELAEAGAEEQRVDLEVKQQKKRLEAEEQMVADAIHQTVSARRGEIEENYRSETAKVLDRQKKVRAERSKAKALGVKSRIEEETADLREENRRLKKELSARMRQDKVPAFCNTTYYYALYFTRGIKELLLLVGTFLIVFLALPCGVYFLIPERKALYLILIYIAVLVIFFGLYILIGNRTKDRYMSALRDGRKIRSVMATNRRRIRAITRSIEKDRDEGSYRLEDYDQRLEQIAQELQDIDQRRGDALRQFDQVTARDIEQEIEGNSREKIDALTRGIQESNAALEDRRSQIQSLNLALTDEYVPYLGKDFMEISALDELAEILQRGEAANLTEARNLYKEKHSKQ